MSALVFYLNKFACRPVPELPACCSGRHVKWWISVCDQRGHFTGGKSLEVSSRMAAEPSWCSQWLRARTLQKS